MAATTFAVIRGEIQQGGGERAVADGLALQRRVEGTAP